MLIGSYFGEKILLITPLFKWYLDHDLKVTKVYKFIEYYPLKCFEQFGLNVSEARHTGDSDPQRPFWLNRKNCTGTAHMANV